MGGGIILAFYINDNTNNIMYVSGVNNTFYSAVHEIPTIKYIKKIDESHIQIYPYKTDSPNMNNLWVTLVYSAGYYWLNTIPLYALKPPPKYKFADEQHFQFQLYVPSYIKVYSKEPPPNRWIAKYVY